MRVLPALLGLCLLLLPGAGSAAGSVAGSAAGSASVVPDGVLVGQVLAALRVDPLYVAPRVAVAPDPVLVRRALAASPVRTYVVVLPQGVVDAAELGIDGLMLQIVEGLADPRGVLLVVSDGGELQVGDGGSSGVNASAVLDQVIAERLEQSFEPGPLTAAIVDVITRVGSQGTGAVTTGGTRRTVGLVGLVAVAALGGGGLLYRRGQRRLAAQAPLTDEPVATEPGWH